MNNYCLFQQQQHCYWRMDNTSFTGGHVQHKVNNPAAVPILIVIPEGGERGGGGDEKNRRSIKQ